MLLLFFSLLFNSCGPVFLYFSDGFEDEGTDPPEAHFTRFGSTLATREFVYSRLRDIFSNLDLPQSPENAELVGLLSVLESRDALSVLGGPCNPAERGPSGQWCRMDRGLSRISTTVVSTSGVESYVTRMCYKITQRRSCVQNAVSKIGVGDIDSRRPESFSVERIYKLFHADDPPLWLASSMLSQNMNLPPAQQWAYVLFVFCVSPSWRLMR